MNRIGDRDFEYLDFDDSDPEGYERFYFTLPARVILCLYNRKLGTAYCPFDITRKDVFSLAFYFKRKYFVLNDHILSETICLFCFCVLFSNMYPKIKFMAKNWSDLCNFYSKVIFLEFLIKKIIFMFLCRN